MNDDAFLFRQIGNTGTLFKDARVPENVQAIAQQGVAASKDFYAKTAAAAQDGAKVMRADRHRVGLWDGGAAAQPYREAVVGVPECDIDVELVDEPQP